MLPGPFRGRKPRTGPGAGERSPGCRKGGTSSSTAALRAGTPLPFGTARRPREYRLEPAPSAAFARRYSCSPLPHPSDAIGGHVLGASVEPDAVGLLEWAADVVGGVEHLEPEVAEPVSRGQARDSAAQDHHVEPLRYAPSLLALASPISWSAAQVPPLR